MAIEKSLSQAPQGLEELASAQPDLSIEIENPESVTLDDGSMEITIEPGKEVDDEFNANLAEDLDEGTLTELSGDLIGEYDADINSRKDWLTTYVEGLYGPTGPKRNGSSATGKDGYDFIAMSEQGIMLRNPTDAAQLILDIDNIS